MVKSLILCNCEGSLPLDAAGLSRTTGLTCSRVHTSLCTREINAVTEEIAKGDILIACAQEQALFQELAEEVGAEAPGCVDLRDRAGWSEASGDALPKMAALLAEAQLPAAEQRAMDVSSEGVCLIAGAGAVVLPLADRLAEALAITVLLTDDAEPPLSRRFDTVRGRLRRVTGALGGFEVTIDALQQMQPGGRGEFVFSEPQDGGRSSCDLLIDLTGGTPMVPAPDKREGYLRADPGNPLAVADLALDAVQLVGTFEKPLYVRLNESLCAHSRAEQTACTNCLDVCPTGAITSAGDHVAIDPMVCAGCGACAALCPSTAITYEDPPLATLLQRIETLARAYSSAGGQAPRLLVQDAHGADMVRMAARFGRGLPADVLPLEVSVVSGFGHAEMLAALAHGFACVTVLVSPKTETDALYREQQLANAIVGVDRVFLLNETDPDEMSNALYASEIEPVSSNPVLLLGNRRQVARLAAQALNPAAEAPLPLPDNAPYGAVLVDKEACTLCLSCVSLCPSGALIENPDMPQIRFQEDACLQCGLCATICPETAIELHPQLDLSDQALTQQILNEEEPFACIECGALFGVKSTVERIMEKLAGKHHMFATQKAAQMIQMCDNCRVNAQFHSEDNPFQGNEPPRPRTTDDYFTKRRDH